MSVRLTPSDKPPQFLTTSPAVPSPSYGGWGGEPSQPQIGGEPEGIHWARYLDVLRRNVVFIVALTVAGSAVGLFVAKRVKPIYEAEATVWINGENGQQGGPIREQQLLPTTSWVELLRSFAIVDPVVRRLVLNVFYKQPADSVLFGNFQSSADARPGSYVLRVDAGGRSYQLSTEKGIIVERGTVGDSIGRKLGFFWLPEPRFLTRERVIHFSVSTPRSASMSLLSEMRSTLPEDGQFLRISLSGSDAQRTAQTVNAWAGQFVISARDLKKHHLLEFKKTLGEQLRVAEGQLQRSEDQLERFRINTITLPSASAPLSVGVGAARDPVITNYFQQKATVEEVRSDRTVLERMIAEANGGPLNTQSFLMLPSILNNAPQLRTAIEELSSRQAALRSEQQYLTDANPRIKQLAEAVHVLEYQTIPQISQSVLASLRAQEQTLTNRITTQSQDLRGIPARSIEEMRLVRQVSASENLYNSLKSRYEEVALAEVQTTPDVSLLDSAVAPLTPSSNSAPRLLLLAVAASIGFAVGIALLRDRLDRTFRYPEEATHELGLVIAGTVPLFKPNRRGDFQLATMSQAIESFRTLRLAVRYDFKGDEPVVLTVSSPSAGDGKSLVSSNLALAFAGAGHRTLLIDGDIRCGTQDATFGVPVSPGLVDYLRSAAGIDEVVKSSSSENLFVIPRGSRGYRAPELLVSERMGALVHAARQQFEVVIIDSAPFVAGVDAYALGAAAGSILIVLRPGVTDRKLGAAKLEILDRLPIRVLGAVLNGVPDGGVYRYYGNDYSYGGGGMKEQIANVATPGGLVLRA